MIEEIRYIVLIYQVHIHKAFNYTGTSRNTYFSCLKKGAPY